jgi:MFS family permease
MAASGSGRIRGAFAHGDFRLLFAGRCASLLGDGAFLVAMAWEAYTLSGGPAALSLLGIAMTLPLVALLLVGGVVSDRYDRRRVMLSADLARAALLVLLGTLASSGALRLWEMVAIVAAYGCAQAFFDPASDALLPEILPAEQLGAGNALEEVARPLMLRLAGPALGGLLVGLHGSGAAFLADGGTFLISALMLCLMSSRRPGTPAAPETAAASARTMRRDVGEAWRYVRGHAWLWVTLVAAGIAYLLFMGPAEVLLPFVVKRELHGDGLQLGLVMGAGGLGSVACALTMARSSLPARGIRFVYSVWTMATLAVVGYGLAHAVWQLMLASLAFNLLETAGTIVWMTMKQQRVPTDLLGRVSSLDWLISIGLLPLSFALTAPVAALIGARATLVAAGCAGAAVTLAGLLVPGIGAGEERVEGGVGSVGATRA